MNGRTAKTAGNGMMDADNMEGMMNGMMDADDMDGMMNRMQMNGKMVEPGKNGLIRTLIERSKSQGKIPNFMPKNKSFEDVRCNGNGVDQEEVVGGDGRGDDGAGGARKMMNDAATIPAKDEIPIRQTRRRKFGVVTTKGAKSKSRGGMGPKTGSVSSQMEMESWMLFFLYIIHC